MTAQLQVAKVTATQLNEIQSLEQELGSWLVALEPTESISLAASNDEQWAELSGEQIARLQAVEEKLGVVMLAVYNESTDSLRHQ